MAAGDQQILVRFRGDDPVAGALASLRSAVPAGSRNQLILEAILLGMPLALDEWMQRIAAAKTAVPPRSESASSRRRTRRAPRAAEAPAAGVLHGATPDGSLVATTPKPPAAEPSPASVASANDAHAVLPPADYSPGVARLLAW